MSDGVMFDKDSAALVAQATRRVLHLPHGDNPAGYDHKPRGGGLASDYTGPWACVQKDSTTVTIKAHDIEGGYICKSLVIAGLTTTEHASDEDLTILVSGVVYAHVTESAGVYSVVFGNAATLPAQTSGHFYAPLAYVTFADGTITGLAQAQHGQIYPNRIV